jgi:hypothetical protein
MSTPKLHHYVPQFYLRRFVDDSGRLGVWERGTDRTFQAAPKSLAAERSFYHLDLYSDQDPVAMEKQFAQVEYDVARITGQWIEWVRAGEPGEQLPVPTPNRETFSLFLALQFLRTADVREILSAIGGPGEEGGLSPVEKRVLHTEALWDQGLVGDLADYIESAIWMFGRNDTEVSFVTSDNPVAFRSPDHSIWLKVGLLGEKAYAVYPLAPDIVIYCYPRVEPWSAIEFLDCCISPVTFTEEMVESDNTGQAFMASRFVFSRDADFDQVRAFAKTIGTDRFAP